MANLVSITDPNTGRVYNVHPHIAESGEWFASDKATLRAQLPGIAAFERGVARLAAAHPATQHTQNATRPAAALEGAAHG